MKKTPSATAAFPRFPRSFMHASATELDAVSLNLIAGQIPVKLQGHLFLIAPVGSVNSNGLPNPDNSHVWNGNGLIYRFDFKPGESVRLTTRLARTPCYWADFATRRGTAYEGLGFQDWGMARFSLSLGMRNQLNTAFVPMRFSNDKRTRLLVTFDGGRPYEIDPVSLKVVTPVGNNSEWQPGISLQVPFSAVLSTAHPVFDPESSTLYSINYGRSTGNLLSTIPLIALLSKLSVLVARFLWPITLLLHALLKPFRWILNKGMGPADFVYLLAWDGCGSLKRWNLVDKEGKPIVIQQTMHQMGSSKDYLLLADTSLKFGLEQLLPGPFSLPKPLSLLLRKILTNPQNDYTNIYIVRKSDLVRDKEDVIAKCATLPFELAHFLVDQEDMSGRITLHTAHENAADVSEWVRPEDVSATDQQPLDSNLGGMISVGPMDVGRLGRYEIDGEAGVLLKSQTYWHESYTWGVGLYAVRDQGASDASLPAKIRSVYWQSLGFWPDLLSEFIFKLYKDYPSRLTPLKDLLSASKAGERPSTLFRVDTVSMSIVDAYPFPQYQRDDGSWQAWVCNSPQFVPNPATDGTGGGSVRDPETDGWIICFAISEQNKELWIFDAANLAGGPLCKLSHPDFNPGYTIHTTWLEKIESRTSRYFVDPRTDYDPLLGKAPKSVRNLFEQEIYPRMETS